MVSNNQAKVTPPISGDSAMATYMRNQQWQDLPIGPPQNWPYVLRAILNTCINAKTPMALFWGNEHYFFFNDAFGATMGDRHKIVFGKPAGESFKENWNILNDYLNNVLITGKAEELKGLTGYRKVGQEKRTYDLTLNPVFNDDGIAGVFAVVHPSCEEAIPENNKHNQCFRHMIDSLAAAIYTTDAEGRLTHYNQAAIDFSGYKPELGTDMWCVTWKLYWPDGTPMSHDECPMATALKEGRKVYGMEAIAERPDGKRIWFQPYPSPLFDENGKIIGGVNMLVDITERKQAEEELIRSKAELSDFFSNATVGLHWVGPDGRIIKANQAELDLLGYSREEYIGHSISDFHADQDTIDDILTRLKSGEELHNYEARLRCKDGSIKHVLISSNVLEEDGKFIHTRCFTSDITSRKQTERLLQEKETLLEMIATGAPLEECLNYLCSTVSRLSSDMRLAILLTDEKRRKFTTCFGIDFTSEFCEKLTSMPISDLPAGTCSEAVLKGIPVNSQEISADTRWSQEWQYICLSNGVQASYSLPIKGTEGQIVGTLMLGFDKPRTPNAWEYRLADIGSQIASIALERDRSHKALMDSEASFRGIFETTPECVKLMDRNGKLLHINPSGLAMIGANGVDEIAGRNIYDLIEPKHREAYRLFNEKVCDGEKGTISYDIIWPDGIKRHYESCSAPLEHPSGETIHLSITRDVTEKKKADETQSLLLAELNHRVKNMLATIQAIASQTLRQSSGMSEFIENFNGRLHALARAHSLLTKSSWRGASIHDILKEQLVLHIGSDRVNISGPPCYLPPRSSLYLALVLHELSTNAQKHGALSTNHGVVIINWEIVKKDDEFEMIIKWKEEGGPQVSTPKKSGFGRILIEQSLKSIGGDTKLQFDKTGISCILNLPMSESVNYYTNEERWGITQDE